MTAECFPNNPPQYLNPLHINTLTVLSLINSSTQTIKQEKLYGLEDIKQEETTFERGDTTDRNDWSSSNNRIRYHSMGSTTLTIHRVEYEQ